MQKLQSKSVDFDKFNKGGLLGFHNKKELKTPICWFGLSIIESSEFQLEVFKNAKIEAFLSNVYDLYYTDKKEVRKNIIEELQRQSICHKMDSGGFQLMKAKMKNENSKFPLTPKMVLDKQLEIGCDIGVQLDFPFGPELTHNQKMKRLNETFSNLTQMLKLIDEYGVKFSYLPVIHTVSDDLDLLNYCIDKLEEILGKPPDKIGLGSLVPLVKSMKGSKKNGIESLIYTIITLRKLLPETFIHAFGIGGTMAYLAVLAGIGSYDSNGWIQKAAYGVIQLPGISDRFLRQETHNRPYLIRNRKQRNCKDLINEIDIFMKCKCSACIPFYRENWIEKDWKLKQSAFIGRERQPRLNRAIHIVSLYQSEIFKIREAIKDEKLKDLVKSRLKFSIYYKYIHFIEELKSKPLDNLNDFKELIKIDYHEIKELL